MIDKINIFLVDDDPLFLKALQIDFLEMENVNIHTFSTGERCLKEIHQNPTLIVLDYHLNGVDVNAMNGIETLDEIKKINSNQPVVILSSQDKIEVAVNCMHHNAFDYVVKSETSFLRLKKILSTITHFQKIEKELNWYMDRM